MGAESERQALAATPAAPTVVVILILSLGLQTVSHGQQLLFVMANESATRNGIFFNSLALGQEVGVCPDGDSFGLRVWGAVVNASPARNAPHHSGSGGEGSGLHVGSAITDKRDAGFSVAFRGTFKVRRCV